jgi:hypothetical protein
MKILLIHGVAISLALASFAGTAPSDPAPKHPIACQLDAFSAADRARHDKLMTTLLGEVREVKELPDGYAFRLPTDAKRLAEVGEWISLERQCCPFFNFDLAWTVDDHSPWLRVTGTKEVKAFLSQTKMVQRG